MRSSRATFMCVIIAATGAVTAGCGSSSTSTSSSDSTTTTAYKPAIDPATFSDRVSNRYFPLTPGTVYVYEGTEDGEPQRNEVTVTTDTKVILGVRCVVVHDVVFVDGVKEEETFDWYAQDADGAVWYFGEDSKEFDTTGEVTSTKGSWEAGVGGAQPGVVMLAQPEVGRTYRQEYAKGEAEDMATILDIRATATAPAGSYRDVVVTKDFTPLEPANIEHKSYAPGIGFVSGDMISGGKEHTALVSIKRP